MWLEILIKRRVCNRYKLCKACKKDMTMLALIAVITLLHTRQLTANFRVAMSLDISQFKALHGHSFLNISGIKMETCLEHCLINCLCLSFQICGDEPKCQLCSSNKNLNSEALRQSQSCTNFDFTNQMKTETCSSQQCGHSSTVSGFNCCMTSHPCLNGGSCLRPLPSSNKRFRCECPDGYEGERCGVKLVCKLGYTGHHCDQPIRSCRGYGSGSRVDGIYTVLDVNNAAFKVFCNFTGNSTTWTLIQSYKLRSITQLKFPLYKDYPGNQNLSSFAFYRLSKTRMGSIQNDSTKWRLTCGYETGGVVRSKDYVQASKAALDILTLNFSVCVTVDEINISGRKCTDYAVLMRQNNKTMLNCLYKNYLDCSHSISDCNGYNTGADKQYLGYYPPNVNNQQSCSSFPEAIIQTWLGATD